MPGKLLGNGWYSVHPVGLAIINEVLLPKLENVESTKMGWVPLLTVEVELYFEDANKALFEVKCVLGRRN